MQHRQTSHRKMALLRADAFQGHRALFGQSAKPQFPLNAWRRFRLQSRSMEAERSFSPKPAAPQQELAAETLLQSMRSTSVMLVAQKLIQRPSALARRGTSCRRFRRPGQGGCSTRADSASVLAGAAMVGPKPQRRLPRSSAGSSLLGLT